MVPFLASLLRCFLNAFSSRRTILSEKAVLMKENEILLRRIGRKRVHFTFYDRFFFVVLNQAADFNRQRLHQGIQQQTPKPSEAERTRGPIRKSAVLGGLHHHYSRQAA